MHQFESVMPLPSLPDCPSIKNCCLLNRVLWTKLSLILDCGMMRFSPTLDPLEIAGTFPELL